MLAAFHDAKRIGVEPPGKLVRPAVAATELQKLPDFSCLYGSYLKWQPRREINRPAGSLGRSQACNLALRLWGDETVTDAVLEEWLERLVGRNGWLEMGRKRPIPHESFAQVAGYFDYFGHSYAARVIDELPPPARPPPPPGLAGPHPPRRPGCRRLLVGLPALRLPPALRHRLRAHDAAPLPEGDAAMKPMRPRPVA